MRCYRILFLCLLMALPIFYTCPNAKNQSIKIIPGEYLSNRYISELNKTLSPLKAIRSGICHLLIITADPAGYHIQSIYNFNEGGPEFLLTKDGTITTTLQAGANTENVSLQVVDSQRICFGFGEFNIEQFTYVNSAERYVGSKCLLGEYLDSNGNKFIFNKEGKGIFPDKTGSFAVVLFYFPKDKYDYLKIDSTEYAFQMTPDSLKIFNITGGEIFPDGEVEENPRYVLKRVK